MTCLEVRQFLDGYFDGELDLVHSIEVERHLEECPACAESYGGYREIRGAFEHGSLYHRAPVSLREAVRAAIRSEPRVEALPRPRPRENSIRWTAIAASVFILAAVAIGLLFVRNRPSQHDLIAREVVDAHIRSLMGNHLTDVVSSDRHTVKPWFNGKLDFSPVVKDLSSGGFPLIGGRLEYIDGHPAAALVYRRNLHTINLFVWPSGATGGRDVLTTGSTRGYHAVSWHDTGMTYWAVSDVQLEDLDRFARDLQKQ